MKGNIFKTYVKILIYELSRSRFGLERKKIVSYRSIIQTILSKHLPQKKKHEKVFQGTFKSSFLDNVQERSLSSMKFFICFLQALKIQKPKKIYTKLMRGTFYQTSPLGSLDSYFILTQKLLYANSNLASLGNTTWQQLKKM